MRLPPSSVSVVIIALLSQIGALARTLSTDRIDTLVDQSQKFGVNCSQSNLFSAGPGLSKRQPQLLPTDVLFVRPQAKGFVNDPVSTARGLSTFNDAMTMVYRVVNADWATDPLGVDVIFRRYFQPNQEQVVRAVFEAILGGDESLGNPAFVNMFWIVNGPDAIEEGTVGPDHLGSPCDHPLYLYTYLRSGFTQYADSDTNDPDDGYLVACASAWAFPALQAPPYPLMDPYLNCNQEFVGPAMLSRAGLMLHDILEWDHIRDDNEETKIDIRDLHDPQNDMWQTYVNAVRLNEFEDTAVETIENAWNYVWLATDLWFYELCGKVFEPHPLSTNDMCTRQPFWLRTWLLEGANVGK